MTSDVYNGQFCRVAETDRNTISLTIDGQPVQALEGDTLLTALLVNRRNVRQSEWGDGPRAGFCLMAACQDCWVWTEDGRRLRACSEPARDGMNIRTSALIPVAAHV